MATILVSRHPGVAAWAAHKNYAVDRQVEHLEMDSIRPGDIVIGILPFQIAAEIHRRGGRFFALILDLPFSARGRELTVEEMDAYGARLVEYSVTAVDGAPNSPNPASSSATPGSESEIASGDILLTFLGTGKYEETGYLYADRKITGTFSVLALREIFHPAKIFIGLTEAAQNHAHWAMVKAQLEAFCQPYEIIPLPDCRDEAEFWAMFSALAAAIPRQSRLIVDMTHGFRSLPLVAILTVMYLASLKRIELLHVLYGAFRPGHPETPFIDLAPFFVLNAWAAAAAELRQTQDARPLAALLKTTGQEWYRGRIGAEINYFPLHRQVQNLAGALANITDVLLLNRTQDLSNAAKRLQTALDQAGPALKQISPAVAFFLDDLRRQYAWCLEAKDLMAAHRQAIEVTARAGWLPQAILLLREWVVSAIAVQNGRDPAEHAVREDISACLGARTTIVRHTAPVRTENPMPPDRMIPWEYVSFWNNIADFRNDLAHCGLRSQPRPADAMKRKLEDYLAEWHRLSVAIETKP